MARRLYSQPPYPPPARLPTCLPACLPDSPPACPPAPQDEDWISELVEKLWPYTKAAVEKMAWEMLPGGWQFVGRCCSGGWVDG